MKITNKVYILKTYFFLLYFILFFCPIVSTFHAHLLVLILNIVMASICNMYYFRAYLLSYGISQAYYKRMEPAMPDLPEQHLFEQTIGCADPGLTSCVEPMQLQFWRDHLCCHLCICCCASSAATENITMEIQFSKNFKICIKLGSHFSPN